MLEYKSIRKPKTVSLTDYTDIHRYLISRRSRRSRRFFLTTDLHGFTRMIFCPADLADFADF